MSPNSGPIAAARAGFPRVSGDEPSPARTLGLSTMFSPRERG